MRVGTDGVLLGAWCSVAQARKALDIGTGTGVIALMLAQRNPGLEVTAIDIDQGAWFDAQHNFEHSPWANRLQAYCTSVQDFTGHNDEPFDLIVCNPPYFQKSLRAKQPNRSLARHAEELSFSDLVESVVCLLSPKGIFSVIIPIEEQPVFLEMAHAKGLFMQRQLLVRHNDAKPLSRVLMEFGLEHALSTEQGEMCLETHTRHELTNEFASLVQDFYLSIP